MENKNHKEIKKSLETLAHKIGIAEHFYETGEYAQALEEIREAEELWVGKDKSINYGKFQLLFADILIEMGDYRQAKERADEALQILKETGENRAVARLQQTLAIIHLSLGSLEKAEIFCEDSLSSYRRIDDEKGILESINRLAQICCMRSEWSRAIDYLEYGYERSNGSSGEGDPWWIAVFSGNLGSIHFLMGNWTEAERYLDSSIKIYESISETLQICRRYISYGRLKKVQRNWEKAYLLLNEALVIAEENGYTREMCLAYKSLGELAFDQQDYDEAYELLSKARKIAEEIAPQGDLVVDTLRHLAELYVTTDRTSEALEVCKEASKSSLKLGDKLEEACCYRILGLIHKALGKREEAFEYLSKGVELLTDLGEKFERAKTLLHLAGSVAEGGKWDDALNYLSKSREIFDSLPSKYWVGVAEMEIAKVKLATKDTDSAIILVNRAQAQFQEIDEKDAATKVRRLRKTVENAMVEFALSTEREYFSAKNNGESFHELLRSLAKKARARRLFVAVKNCSSFDIKGFYNIEKKEAHRIIRYLSNKGYLNNNGRNLILSNLRMERKLPVFLRDRIQSLILVPFESGEDKGILYLDNPDEPFSQKDLTLSIMCSHSLALKFGQMREEKLERENERLRRELGEKYLFPEVIGQSKALQRVFRKMTKIMNDDCTVLITGESGSGKEVIARAIHNHGNRKDRPFLAINCGALPETLLEAELFGSVRGAFTGAVDKKGYFETAGGGTLFLDEVHHTSEAMQIKLLRAVQEKEILRVGGTRPIKVNARLMCATNEDLDLKTEEGRFRQDLYWRINKVTIDVPPLRDRREDIPPLVHYFLERYSKSKKKHFEGIDKEAMEALSGYHWAKNNVRELETEIERVVIFAKDRSTISIKNLSEKLRRSRSDKASSFSDQIERYERENILKALKENSWVKRKAARNLGMPESTLRRKVKKYHLPESASCPENEFLNRGAP